MRYRVDAELLRDAEKAHDWYEAAAHGHMRVAKTPPIPAVAAYWILRHCVTRDEVGWLIEWPGDSDYATRWWAGGAWSTDVHQAIRFARREDAERARVTWLHDQTVQAQTIVTEHMWCSQT